MRRCFCPGKWTQVERILCRKVSYAEPETCRLTCWDGYTSPAGDGLPSSTWFRLLPSYKELTYRTDVQTNFILASLPWNLRKFMSIESMMPSNQLILCHPLLLLLSIFPSIRVFSDELALPIRWPKYWSFSFSITTSNEYSGLISFRIDWFALLGIYTCVVCLPAGLWNAMWSTEKLPKETIHIPWLSRVGAHLEAVTFIDNLWLNFCPRYLHED